MANRTCPDCGRPMAHLEQAGLALDRCDACEGIWFDEGELKAYAASAGHHRLEEARLRHYFSAFKTEAQRCPACEAPSLRAGLTAGYAILGCDACGGFFLPPGTLARMRGLSRTRRRRSSVSTLDSLDLSYLGDALADIVLAVFT